MGNPPARKYNPAQEPQSDGHTLRPAVPVGP